MRKIQLYQHQSKALEETQGKNRVAYYHDMGLGKTFTGAEKLVQLRASVNLVICQKSKVNDWVEHFEKYYGYPGNLETGCNPYHVIDLTKWKLGDFKNEDKFITTPLIVGQRIYIINYELAFRRPELMRLRDFTLMLDESSMIQNENAKRSKFILNLKPKNVILLSGTPTGGKYEKLWSQLHLLGWNISKDLYYRQYVDVKTTMNEEGFPVKVIKGYKNVERLKQKLREHGANFLKTEEVFDLPKQTFTTINIPTTKEYRKFRKAGIVNWMLPDGFRRELVGDTTLTKMLYERQLCGQYNPDKLEAFKDLVESTNDRLVVFYNFTHEMEVMRDLVNEMGREYSRVDGSRKDLTAYEEFDDSITFIQYQAGAMGLNLQKANKIVYFTPPLSSELFEQSKKRIHRIGQDRPCFYYFLTCKNSVEARIYSTLEMRKDYTDKLFEEGK